MVINYDCVSSDNFLVSFTISVKLLPTSEAPLRTKLVSPVPCGIVPPSKTFSTITSKLVQFYLDSNVSCHVFKHFWKGIKPANNVRLPNYSNVGGACGAENVRNM